MGENNGDDLRFVSPDFGRREVGDVLNPSLQEKRWGDWKDKSKEDYLWAIKVGLEPKVTIGFERFYGSDLGSFENFENWMGEETMAEITQKRCDALEQLVSSAMGKEMSFPELVQLVVDDEGIMVVYRDDRDDDCSRRIGIFSMPWLESEQSEVLEKWRCVMWPPLTEEQLWECGGHRRERSGPRQEALDAEEREYYEEEDRRDTRWRPEQSAEEYLEELREDEDTFWQDEVESLEDENWGERGYAGMDETGRSREGMRDWEMMERLFEAEDEEMRDSVSDATNQPNRARAERQLVRKHGKPVVPKSRGRDETSVDSESWAKRRYVTNPRRPKVSDTENTNWTYGDAQRDAGDRRAGEKIQWQDEAQEEVANTLDPYESDKHDKEMPKKPYESARLEGQRAVAKVIADSRLQRRIDEHRRRLQERKMQQQQARKYRSSERVDWYQDMMRKRYEKSQETRHERRRGK